MLLPRASPSLIKPGACLGAEQEGDTQSVDSGHGSCKTLIRHLVGKKEPSFGLSCPHLLPQEAAPRPLSITCRAQPPPLPLSVPPSLLADFSNRLSPLWEGKVWVRRPVPPYLQDLSSPCPFCPKRSGGREGDRAWKGAQGQAQRLRRTGQGHRGQRGWTELSDQG